MPAAAPPGWHGKLPSLGDFAARRLDAAFIEPWDGWLAAGLLALREARPAGWLDDYLASPSWRFLLMPGVLPGAAGTQAWCGVLMPSVDRVGRYFPLTLVLPLGAGPASAQESAALWPWLARLDELARDALYEDWTADRLEEQLARMALPALDGPLPDLAGPERAGALVEAPVGIARDPARLIGSEAQRAWARGVHGRAWWHAHPDEQAPRLLVSQGLPAAASLHRLFGPAATI
ncbi:MAG: type VI secretion system-associated protein TagF [Leptothrix sp. (in: Bacteria)]|nr:type VI secretion system-associated protein TagF [Leptothrix sp. (in: b-proteobacteria)]